MPWSSWRSAPSVRARRARGSNAVGSPSRPAHTSLTSTSSGAPPLAFGRTSWSGCGRPAPTAGFRWPSVLARLWYEPYVRAGLLPAIRVGLFGLVVGHRARDDDLLAPIPVDRRGDLVLRRELERIDHPQHLVEVAPCRHRINEDQLDLLVRPDHEHVADRLVA